MTKRLHGWAMEKETSKKGSSSSFECAPQSALASKLLSLWSHGSLSATAIQEIAHLAILDGANHPELALLAQAGSFGENQGNIHRDVVRAFCKDIQIDEPFLLDTVCIDPKSSQEEVVQTCMYLPHLMFANLGKYSHQQFAALFSIDSLEQFWTNTQRLNDDRLFAHPILEAADWKTRCIPIFIHADGVEFQSRDTLLAFSWGNLLSPSASLDSHFLIALFAKSCTANTTWQPMMKWLVWSLVALMKGKHPEADPDGNPLQKGTIFAKLQGLDLVPGRFKGILWSIQGDHEMFANVLKLPHWKSHRPCWECDCTQSLDHFPVEKHYKTLRPSLQNLIFVDTAAAITNPRSEHPLFKVPGVTTRIVRHDLLHILWHNGIYSHLLGSVLHYLCWKQPPGHHQTVNPATRLGIIFEHVQAFYKANMTPTRLTNLRLSMFTSVKSPFANKPALSTKAAESKHLLPALFAVCKAVLDPAIEVDRHIVSSLGNMDKLVKTFDQADIFLTESEFDLVRESAEFFLDNYAHLHSWAEEHGRNLFHTGPLKFHTFWHCILNSCHLNPKVHWTFLDEDFVGRISKLAHSVSHGVRSTKLPLKMSPKYRLLVHLRMSRMGFPAPDMGDD